MITMRSHARVVNIFDEEGVHIGFDSSNLCCGRWDEDFLELELHFVSGGTYTYHDVPRAVVEALLLAPSAGAFFSKRIKPRYVYTKETP